MQKIAFLLVSSIVALSLFGVAMVFQKTDQTTLSYPAKSINSWYSCQDMDTRIPECTDDAVDDYQSCLKASVDVYRCQDFNAFETRVQSCTNLYGFIENTKNYDTLLPADFKRCADDCRQFAKQNKFFYEKIYTVMWDYCGSY